MFYWTIWIFVFTLHQSEWWSNILIMTWSLDQLTGGADPQRMLSDDETEGMFSFLLTSAEILFFWKNLMWVRFSECGRYLVWYWAAVNKHSPATNTHAHTALLSQGAAKSTETKPQEAQSRQVHRVCMKSLSMKRAQLMLKYKPTAPSSVQKEAQRFL